jgi:excisionase family DNA binding protein
MRKSRPNHRLIKIHRSYTAEEIARLLGIHKNTVREWVRTGLPTIDDRRPRLIKGKDLVAFLQARQVRKKRPCAAGQMFCMRCRVPKFPAAGMVDYVVVTEQIANLSAICPDCSSLMHQCVSTAKLKEFLAKANVAFPQALRRLSEINQPSVNSALK